MKLEYFSYLIVIDKYHSISEAARHLYLGQTTLSAIVKSVEDELGYQIFQRMPKGVMTTKKGEEMIKYAREITLRYESVVKLKEEKIIETYPFTMLSSHALNTQLSLDLNRFLREKNSGCAINFYERSRLKVVPDIIQHHGSIGLTYLYTSELEDAISTATKYKVVIEEILTDKYYVFVNKRHAFAQRTSIEFSELMSEWHACSIEFSDGDTNENSPFVALGRYNSKKRTSFSSIDLVKKAVLHQDMVTILPGSVAANIYDPGLFSVVPLYGMENQNDLQLCLIHYKNMRDVENDAVQFIQSWYEGRNILQLV